MVAYYVAVPRVLRVYVCQGAFSADENPVLTLIVFLGWCNEFV